MVLFIPMSYRMIRKGIHMKRMLSCIMCIAVIITMCVSFTVVEAAELTSEIRYEYILNNGFIVIEEIIEEPISRTTVKQGTKRATIKDGETIIAVISFTAQFGYDGSSSWVVSKSVTQTDTYDGWNYKQKSFVENDATVTLNYKLSKWLILNNTYSMSLSCDENGVLS